MKIKLPVLTLCVAVILAMPALSRAQDNSTTPSTNAPAATAPAKKHAGLPFHGNLVSVDTNAMSFVVGTHTITVTSDTKITKDGKPATLSDGVVGQPVSGYYKKGDDGALKATTVHFGVKGGKKKTDSTSTTTPSTGN
jgi:hypothetical protein